MGESKATKLQLAQRITRGIETKSGRYDWASKIEVREYVTQELLGVRTAHQTLGTEIDALTARIAELELTAWQRFKRMAARLQKTTQR